MIVTHSLVLEWLRHFLEGRTICGYNERGVWWNDSKKSTHLAAWSEVQEWAAERDRRAHCEFDADNERDDKEGDES